MAPQADRIYSKGEDLPAAPPGSYYSVKDLNQMPPLATYQQRRRRRSCCCCCFLWMCSIFTILIVSVGIAVLVFWLVVQPKAPKFDVDQISVNSSAFLSTPYNVDVKYNITARNPNKKVTFYYSDIRMFVQKDGTDLAKGTYPDFVQGHKNTTNVSGDLVGNNLQLSSDTLSAITNNLSNAKFYAQIDLKAKLKIGSIKTGNFKIKLKCDIYLDLTKSVNQLKSQDCHVRW